VGSIAEMTRKYVGQSFKNCSCMDLAFNWFQELGIDVPYSFADLNVKTYLIAWEKDKKGTIDVMLDLFSTLGKEVEGEIKKHDLLAVKEKGNIYAAIALGNGKAITSHIYEGVRVVCLGDRHQPIIARRLI
jgi:hypothetical protein